MTKRRYTKSERHPDVSAALYAMRIKRDWSHDRAASTPPIRDKSPRLEINSVETTVARERKKSGVTRDRYHNRLRLGWSKTRAASTPPGRRARGDAKTRPFYEYDGKRMSLLGWSRHLNLNYRTLIKRMNGGLTFEQAIKHKPGTSLTASREED